MRAADIMRQAHARTGLVNWGDPDFVPRLDRWLAAIERDRGLSDAGRRQAFETALNHACNRLELEALVEQHPHIEDLELDPPVVVTGLPRSGTTALARRLCEAVEVRWLPYWEALRPFGGNGPERRMEARRRHDRLVALAPKLALLHDSTEAAFVDDTELQCLAFGSYALEWHAHVPGWRDAYLAEDQAGVYRYLKRALQALTFLRGGPTRWLIKSPQHMEQLRAIAGVFPGARLVVSVRPKREALRSMDRAMEALSEAFRQKAYPSHYWPERFEIMAGRYREDRRLFPDRREVMVSRWSAMDAIEIEGLAQ